MEDLIKENDLVSLEELSNATRFINESGLIYETPLISISPEILGLKDDFNLYLKLENMQNNGSFKIRGVVNQFSQLNFDENEKLVTFSAGNYGKSFAYVCSKRNLNGKIILPNTVSEIKVNYITSMGLEQERVEPLNLLNLVDDHIRNGYKLVHPIDDRNLICGYSSIAFEIVKRVTDPDIVLVCCGGGALLAGISSTLGLLNLKTQIYGVEPETANSMYQSFQAGHPIKLQSSKSIATGLAPPITGKIAYANCVKHVEEILLVSDEEIKQTCKRLFEIGIKAELSGCAGLAALLFGKILNIKNRKQHEKLNIIVVISGGNVSAEELVEINK